MRDTVNETGLIERVALDLLGEPNHSLSSPGNMRFGTHGSMSIKKADDTWYDHEAKDGGGVFDFVAREQGGTRADAARWCTERGHIAPDNAGTWDYRDEHGTLLYRVIRSEPKRFKQQAADGSWSIKGVRRVPYRLPELRAADPTSVVYIVEGEKDADRLAALGLVATTNSGGAGKWLPEFSDHLKGRRVCILPDNDDAGRNHAAQVANTLVARGIDHRIVDLPNLPEKGDVSDWLDMGGTPAALIQLYDAPRGPGDGDWLARIPPRGSYVPAGMTPLPASGPTIIQSEPNRESQFYSAASLNGKAVPARQWLVDGLVPQKTVTLFSGDGGTGKSLLALQLAVAVSTERAWIGNPVSKGRVIYISAEDDDDELHRRVDDILRAEGCSYSALAGLTLRSLAGEDALLAVDSQLALMKTALFEELDARAAEDTPALIVIDTLADVYPANENDRAKVRQFVGILRGLALKRNCAVMLLAHPSLTGLNSGTGTSGSTAWNNSVRSRLYLSRISDNGYEADPDARVLTTMKANYGRIGGEINVRWQAGVFVAQAWPTGFEALAVGAKGERVFLQLLDQHIETGVRVSQSGGRNYAPKLFAEHPDNEGCTQRAFRTAMSSLFARKTITISEDGPPSKRRSFIMRAAQ
ncbi:RecA-family ATPase [Roseovarius tolerans]|uniref:RecA-family ATPase n=1 Tax=Roseovarius tolerans TaxID=74031 RepID=A0A1H7V020_9RHOB|nr:AAA family ATPase [Roseovarius tolerans]SEM02379.1 RecA-family ATPase [Roseovarius tolerans]